MRLFYSLNRLNDVSVFSFDIVIGQIHKITYTGNTRHHKMKYKKYKKGLKIIKTTGPFARSSQSELSFHL